MGCFHFLRQIKLGDAQIRVIVPDQGKVLTVKFILDTFKLTKKNDFAEIKIPGLNGAPLQFIGAHSRVLSMVLYFDGRATGTDVRGSMKDVSDLMSIDGQTHAPPVLLFDWKGFSFRCVLESMAEEFVSLFPDGRPSRGNMQITCKEMDTLLELVEEE